MWWPFIVVLFYVLSVVPTLIARRTMQNSLSGTTPCFELSIFITMGFVISSFALPIVLARVGTVSISIWTSLCLLDVAFKFFSDCLGSMLPDVERKLYRLLDHNRIFHVLWKRRQRLRWHGLTVWLFLSFFFIVFNSINFIFCTKRCAGALNVYFVVIVDAWIRFWQTVKIPLDRSKRIVSLWWNLCFKTTNPSIIYISVIRTTYI